MDVMDAVRLRFAKRYLAAGVGADEVSSGGLFKRVKVIDDLLGFSPAS